MIDDDGITHKLHMATLCGIAHFDYNEPLMYSYEAAFQVMRQLRLPYTAAVQLFRRMCFNVIARNQDDHTKNISFLMDNSSTWHLAPAYDVTFAFDPDSIWLRQHQMSINGKRERIDREDLLTVADAMSIKKAEAIIDEIVKGVKTWKQCAKEAGVEPEQVVEIGNLHLTKL